MLTRLEKDIKQKVDGRKYPTLKRIKVGRAISAWALIPCNMSIWMLPIGGFMQINISPKLWAKDKIRHLKQSWSLR